MRGLWISHAASVIPYVRGISALMREGPTPEGLWAGDFLPADVAGPLPASWMPEKLDGAAVQNEGTAGVIAALK